MKICPYCKRTLQDNHTQCDVCGTQLISIQSQVVERPQQQHYQQQYPQSVQQMQYQYQNQNQNQCPYQNQFQCPYLNQNQYMNPQQYQNQAYNPYMSVPQQMYMQPTQGNFMYGTKVNNPTDETLKSLSTKIKARGICWLVVGCIQVITAIYGLSDLNSIGWFVSIFETMMGSADFYYQLMANLLFIGIIGVVNICNSVKDIKISKSMLTKPVGIIKRYKFTTLSLILSIIYNLLAGGIVVLLVIIDFVIRSQIIENEVMLEQLETQYS